MKKLVLLTLFCLVQFYTFAEKSFDISSLKISWEVLENNYQNEKKFLSEFTIVNKTKVEFPKTGWVLYYNYGRTVISATGGVEINHINGDFFKMTPTAQFAGIKPGDSLKIQVISSFWAINYSDAPAGLYFTFENDPTPKALNQLILKPFLTEKQFKRGSEDAIGMVTPSSIFENNKEIKDIPSDKLGKIIPTPASLLTKEGKFILTKETKVYYSPELAGEFEQLSAAWVKIFKSKPVISKEANAKNIIRLILDKKASQNEAYSLRVIGDAGIEIKANSKPGVFYGIQSLKALLPVAVWKKPVDKIILDALEITDAPRFSYRGLHLDVGRNFVNKEAVLQLLELMGYYKLNKFHFHITDDEGWRLEIPSLPELAEIGGKRGHTLDEKMNLVPSFGSGPAIEGSNGTGFYSRKDFIEILKYATARHIEVIPEIDFPGHSRAAIVAMKVRTERLIKLGKIEAAKKYVLEDPKDSSVYMSVQMWKDNVICVCQPSVYLFFEMVVADIIEMYKEAKAPLTTVHTGGDEVPAGVWEKSPLCKELFKTSSTTKSVEDLHEYYLNNISAILRKYNLKTAGWEEIALRKTKVDGNTTYIVNGYLSDQGFVPYVWNNVWGWGAEDMTYKLANNGYKVVMCNVTNLYFDLAYNKSPEEPGYYWGGFTDVDKPFSFNPFDYYKTAKEDFFGNSINKNIFVGKERLTDFGKKNVLGIQGQLWSENIKGADLMFYLALPKMIGLAERAWAEEPHWATEKDDQKSQSLYQDSWQYFLNQLGKNELPRIDSYIGVKYRIPLPGLKVEDGKVLANIQFPGLSLRYTTDGSGPTAASKLYTTPLTNKGIIKMKAFDINGRGSKTSIITH